MTISACVVIAIECNHANHTQDLPRKSFFSGESKAAASMEAVSKGWAFLGHMTEGINRKHWCPHCFRRERAAGSI